MSPALLGTVFLLVLPAELPDKTMFATLLLTTRYRPWPVFVGSAAAFAVQCVIAVAAGSVLTLLPTRAVAAVVALLFAIGSVLLFRNSLNHGSKDSAVDTVSDQDVSAVRIMGISFGLLFAAEWGDASQLATAALTARSGDPLTVGIGSWLALVTVAGIAVLVGNRISEHLPSRWLQRTAAVLFAAFAMFAAYEAVLG
ncbi:MAG: TMEM165/GDT1 family protein [Actinomycetota bacterium]|nr:TMEM165/GDT1 family protein [Actinomycetota bacterium]